MQLYDRLHVCARGEVLARNRANGGWGCLRPVAPSLSSARIVSRSVYLKTELQEEGQLWCANVMRGALYEQHMRGEDAVRMNKADSK
ncbi:hypothetical protein CBOM_07407 [Ceraceosorus bombacis]|uniref:Uncharacterized protein n=1 Tax=Ceraceosorus bombacis TaxID=401625 RepID=A0A0N7L998_9BASI|nr:hypothetical protein CBOM_07407 [Ceraceosorus bombacis]